MFFIYRWFFQWVGNRFCDMNEATICKWFLEWAESDWKEKGQSRQKDDKQQVS